MGFSRLHGGHGRLEVGTDSLLYDREYDRQSSVTCPATDTSDTEYEQVVHALHEELREDGTKDDTTEGSATAFHKYPLPLYSMVIEFDLYGTDSSTECGS